MAPYAAARTARRKNGRTPDEIFNGSGAAGWANHECYVPLGHDLSFHSGNTVSTARCTSQPTESHFEVQNIAGSNLPAEAEIVETSEKWNPIAQLSGAENSDSSNLSERLGNENARHDRISREVSGEKGLVDAHGFNPYRALPFLDLENTVH